MHQDEHDAQYRCQWCSKWSVVPRLNADHEAHCAARPSEVDE